MIYAENPLKWCFRNFFACGLFLAIMVSFNSVCNLNVYVNNSKELLSTYTFKLHTYTIKGNHCKKCAAGENFFRKHHFNGFLHIAFLLNVKRNHCKKGAAGEKVYKFLCFIKGFLISVRSLETKTFFRKKEVLCYDYYASLTFGQGSNLWAGKMHFRRFSGRSVW